MSISRIHKTEKFSIIDNEVINDRRLSWKARGVLIYLLSKPNNWEVRLSDIINHSNSDGEIAIRSTFKELLKFGYAKKVKVRIDDETKKKKRGTFYDIYESPQLRDQPDVLST